MTTTTTTIPTPTPGTCPDGAPGDHERLNADRETLAMVDPACVPIV